jgi:hypothetical protein
MYVEDDYAMRSMAMKVGRWCKDGSQRMTPREPVGKPQIQLLCRVRATILNDDEGKGE